MWNLEPLPSAPGAPHPHLALTGTFLEVHVLTENIHQNAFYPDVCLFCFLFPWSAVCRANSTSPSSQTSKMNSMLYQKQFQPNSAGLRMAQHFAGQFNPQVCVHFDYVPNAPPSWPLTSVYFSLQMLSQPNIVSPLVRPPHTNSFAGGVQRSPMGPQMSPNVGGGLMPHPRPQHGQHSQHPSRGPAGPSLGPRGTQAALKAEQDLKVCLHA